MASFGVKDRLLGRALALCAALVTLITIAGCGSGDQQAPPSRPSVSAASGARLKGLSGKWKLGFAVGLTEGAIDYEMAIVEFKPGTEPNTYTVEVVSNAQDFGAAKLESSSATDEEIRIVLSGRDRRFEFVGHPGQRDVKGTMTLPHITISPAWLSPTEDESLEKAQPHPDPDRDALGKTQGATDKLATIKEFIDTHPNSPLLTDAYAMATAQAKKEKYSEQDVQDMLARCRESAKQWGPALLPKVDVYFGSSLARQNYLVDLAKQLLDKAETEFNENTPRSWQVEALAARMYTGQSAEALPAIRKLHEQMLAEPEAEFLLPVVDFLLARSIEASGDAEGALPLYLKLTSPPTREMLIRSMFPDAATEIPSEAVARLWKKVHGNTEGLDAALRQANTEWIRTFATKREAATEPPGHVALLELFTGAQCAPCYAADIASEALQETFPEAELLVIRYHEHIPGPDPLANNDTVDRFGYYQGQGTPWGLVDGRLIDQFYGSPAMIPSAYRAGRSAVEDALKKTTPLRLQLSSKPVEDGIEFGVEVEGLSGADENLRLRLAVVEDEIDMQAPNGIRYHGGIVRSMPGGVEGISPEKGKLSFKGRYSASQIKSALLAHLARAEREYGANFPAKPMELKRLRLVAFVQNDETKAVLQSAAISLGEENVPQTPRPPE